MFDELEKYCSLCCGKDDVLEHVFFYCNKIFFGQNENKNEWVKCSCEVEKDYVCDHNTTTLFYKDNNGVNHRHKFFTSDLLALLESGDIFVVDENEDAHVENRKWCEPIENSGFVVNHEADFLIIDNKKS